MTPELSKKIGDALRREADTNVRVSHCAAPGCHWSTHGDSDSLRCIRKGCPGAAGKHVKANRAIAADLSYSDPGRAADVWRKRAEALAELADAHERSLADAMSATMLLADQVLAVRGIVAPRAV
ncbi:hypothetical protein Sa4125_29830 [Aureimonas sp. SA4125]|uniref:hypothetical protein n=1 Tax=Aureimonas sp. SA4125 TaxID=2826993 RepID=UPI001CC73BB2|nr:hypothetical protein [Aureimonas sp. SA4125]BDA85441.1 hypothetical protein Sa4125_29830 [Aureimonas sp. SA4125]